VPNFIVTGTDTDIGKTVFAAGLVQLIDGVYWKPIQAGLESGTDSELVHSLGVRRHRIIQEAYRLKTPCSPHQAAKTDDVVINPAKLMPPTKVTGLVVEGAGGVLVPVTQDYLFADLFFRWQLPVVLVASTRLGTINHSLLSIEALRNRAIPIHGVAFVGEANEETEAIICDIGWVRRLGRLPIIDNLNSSSLMEVFAQHFRREDFL
jgi:dethiobiotin synthetase